MSPTASPCSTGSAVAATLHRHNLRKAMALALGLIVTLPGGTFAEVVTFYFGGTLTTVTNISGVLDDSVQVGELFQGSFTFDADASPIFTAPGGRLRHYAGREWQMTAGDFTVRTTTHRLITADQNAGYVFNADWGGEGELIHDGETVEYDFQAPGFRLNPGGCVGFHLDTLDLPHTPPDLAWFGARGADVYSVGNFGWGGRVQWLSLDPGIPAEIVDVPCLVPEPSALGLATLSALMLGAAVLRRRVRN